jgi:lipid-A-disaccharide synthase
VSAKTIAIIVGEESGDLLGADLVRSLKKRLGSGLSLIGVGGEHLQAEGLQTMIDPSEMALIGLAEILKRLPYLLRQIRKVSEQIIAARPDVLIIIDSPEFTHRVARQVRKALPQLPVINYICPSVWAWRPERAKAMTAYVNEVLCILPFEPDELKKLGGPVGTYVGHRLSTDADILRVAQKRVSNEQIAGQLMLLPGSRGSEIRRLLPDMLETARILLADRTVSSIILPTLDRYKSQVEAAVAVANVPCSIVTGAENKWQAFAAADVALAASGTVSLELALCGVPHTAVYRLGTVSRLILTYKFIAWSANLPNLIANRVIVPENYDQFFRPALQSRLIAGLMDHESLPRKTQLQGFDRIRNALTTSLPAAETAAERILTYLN